MFWRFFLSLLFRLLFEREASIQDLLPLENLITTYSKCIPLFSSENKKLPPENTAKDEIKLYDLGFSAKTIHLEKQGQTLNTSREIRNQGSSQTNNKT